MKTTIGITALASVSPLGSTPQEVWEAYLSPAHWLSEETLGESSFWTGRLGSPLRSAVTSLTKENRNYAQLDESVHFALFSARKAVAGAGWKKGDQFGVNIGSSRGATGLFEKYHTEFLRERRVSVLTSPSTTLGNISSWVAQDLRTSGPELSHSITCSTALHALANGIAWLRSGMATKFLVGGSEAPLTPFTLAQMQALKIYANPVSGGQVNYPCRAMDPEKTANSMVLGEGACMACLETGTSERTLAVIEGIGYATEPLSHSVSLSAEADCLQKSMKMALVDSDPGDVDAVVLHAPGTLKGDQAELMAVEAVFGNRMPALTTNKWKIGHTFGASGMLSLEMAVLMLREGKFIGLPYFAQKAPARMRRLLVNAVGFGGNAVSVLLKAP